MREGGKQGAILAAIYAGVAFGVMWIPVRALEDGGLPGAWASVAFTGLPALLTLPVYWFRRRELSRHNWLGLLGGVLGGVAFGFYTLSLLYTEIVRAILLFYLTPIWGFLLGRIVLGEIITPVRWLAVILGLAGIAVIFGLGDGLPVPENAGDWMALAAGLAWAFASLLILIDEDVSVWIHGAGFFVVSTLLGGVGAVLATSGGALPVPDMADVSALLPWLFVVTLLLTLPAGFATIYGPTRLNPGVVGLLFMAEVAVAAISAALLTDEPFGARETLGVGLVIAAGLLVPLREFTSAKG